MAGWKDSRVKSVLFLWGLSAPIVSFFPFRGESLWVPSEGDLGLTPCCFPIKAPLPEAEGEHEELQTHLLRSGREGRWLLAPLPLLVSKPHGIRTQRCSSVPSSSDYTAAGPHCLRCSVARDCFALSPSTNARIKAARKLCKECSLVPLPQADEEERAFGGFQSCFGVRAASGNGRGKT